MAATAAPAVHSTSPTNTAAQEPTDMTAAPATTAPASIRSDNPTAKGVTLLNVIKGEWIKFRSVASTRMTLAGAFVATIAFGMIFSWTAGSDEAQPGPAALLNDPVDLAVAGTGLTEMVIGVLAVILVAGEYSTGLIRTTLAAVGGRTRLLLAKSAVIGGITAVSMSIAVFLAVAMGGTVYAGDAVFPSVFDSDVLQVIGGATVYLTGIALIAMSLAFLTRSTAAAVGSLIGGVFIGPNLLNLLPESFTDNVLKFLPSEAGAAIMTRVSDPDLLNTGSAYAVFIAWVVAFMVAAGVMLQRRDA